MEMEDEADLSKYAPAATKAELSAALSALGAVLGDGDDREIILMVIKRVNGDDGIVSMVSTLDTETRDDVIANMAEHHANGTAIIMDTYSVFAGAN
jgi:hypothetical protein